MLNDARVYCRRDVSSFANGNGKRASIVGELSPRGFLANFQPGHQGAWVDFKNPNRAPLLFLSGSEDHIMPNSVQASNAKHYKGKGTITEHETYQGRPHLMVAGPGWEEIADHALNWALEHSSAGKSAASDIS